MKHKLTKFQKKKLIAKAHKLLDRVDLWLASIVQAIRNAQTSNKKEVD